jgi:hypothetical protein
VGMGGPLCREGRLERKAGQGRAPASYTQVTPAGRLRRQSVPALPGVSIPSFFIRDHNVELSIPNSAAAPLSRLIRRRSVSATAGSTGVPRLPAWAGYRDLQQRPRKRTRCWKRVQSESCRPGTG